jgi:hypothetical protein
MLQKVLWVSIGLSLAGCGEEDPEGACVSSEAAEQIGLDSGTVWCAPSSEGVCDTEGYAWTEGASCADAGYPVECEDAWLAEGSVCPEDEDTDASDTDA